MSVRLAGPRAAAVGLAVALGGLGFGSLAFAQGAPPSGSVTGTITAIVSATSTSPEEIVVAPAGTTNTYDTYALGASTAYTLAAPGLDGVDVALTAAAVAVGETVSVTTAAAGTPPTAGGVWVDGVLVDGQVTAVSASGFTVDTGGTITAVADAALPATEIPADGAEVAVYGIATGTDAMSAYAVYAQGYPAVSGTISSVQGGEITLAADAGSFAASLGSAPVTVGDLPATSAFLLPGAQATVSYAVSEAGASATAVSVAATTVTGTLQAAPQAASGVSTFTVVTAAGTTQQVSATGAATVTGGTLAGAAAGTPVSVTGVLVGSLLSAVQVTLGGASTAPPGPPASLPVEVSGAVAAVSASSITIDAEDGPFTAAIDSATRVQVGDVGAAASDLAPGQDVAIGLAAAATGSGGAPTAATIRIEPQHLVGTITAVASTTAFTVRTGEGELVAVTVAAGATTGDAGSAPAVGDRVEASGLDAPPAAFEAFALSAAVPPPVSARGTITALTPTSLTLSVMGPGGRGRGERANRNRRGDAPNSQVASTETFALTGTTRVSVGDRTLSTDVLAVGEWATVVAASGSAAAGDLVAESVMLAPSRLVGTILTVAASGTDTVLTVATRGRGPRPLDAARRRDGGRPQGASVAVEVLPDTTLTSPGTTTAPTLAVGQRINVDGSWTGTTLMAAQVMVLPASASGSDRGHAPGHH